MPKFAANITTMYHEHPVAERMAAAADHGFTAVEFLYPYAYTINEVAAWLNTASVKLILINTAPGDSKAGEVGLAALPGREDDFRVSFNQALSYASALNVPMVHVLAGRTLKKVTTSESTFIKNIRWAADLAVAQGINLLLEPLNTTDVPGYLYTDCDQTMKLIDSVNRPNVKIQFDFYHRQMMAGDLISELAVNLENIGHIQFSSMPGRHEPQHGDVSVDSLFLYLDEIGYTGWIGCEYTPLTTTAAGLTWAAPYGIEPH